MFIRKIAVMAVTAACLLVVGASTASAGLVEDPGGGLVPVGSTITNGGSHPAVLTLPGLGAVTCNSTATTFTLTTNDTLHVAGNLNRLDFTSCTDTVPFITINSCSLRGGTSPGVTLVPTTANAGDITLTDTIVRCFTASPITGNHTSGCDYTAAAAQGTTSNSPSKITFTNVAVSHVSGTTGDLGALCGSTASFSTALTDLRTDSAAANTVTLVP